MALGVGAVWLAISIHRLFSSSPIFEWGSGKDYGFIGLLALLGVALIVVAYDFGFRRGDA